MHAPRRMAGIVEIVDHRESAGHRRRRAIRRAELRRARRVRRSLAPARFLALRIDIRGEPLSVIRDAPLALKARARRRDQPGRQRRRATRHRVALDDDAFCACFMRASAAQRPAAPAPTIRPAPRFRRRRQRLHARSCGAELGHGLGDRDHRAERAQRGERRLMHLAREGGAAVGKDRDVEIAHMRVAHRRGDAAIGDDAADVELLDIRLAQHPFEPAHVEGRIGDLLDREIDRLENVDRRMSPGARLEIPFAEKRPERLEVRRDERLATLAGNEGEMGRDDEAALRPHELGEGLHAPRQGRDLGRGEPGAAIGAFGIDEIVLQIADQKSRAG